jgi:transposase
MPKRTRIVIGGVDTHGRTHHAAVIDQQGRLLGDRQFPADRSGYRQLLSWLHRHGRLGAVGVEGTGSYGAGLTQTLLDQGVRVVEVDRPDRRTRRQRGRSDPIDAEAAARAVLAGTATAVPKRRDGIVESIRALRTARSGAVKARTAAINQLKALLVTAPASLREALDGRSTPTLVAPVPGCALTRPRWPTQSRGPRPPWWWSPSASSCWTRRSPWPTSGWPPWSVGPRPGCWGCWRSAPTTLASC